MSKVSKLLLKDFAVTTVLIPYMVIRTLAGQVNVFLANGAAHRLGIEDLEISLAREPFHQFRVASNTLLNVLNAQVTRWTDDFRLFRYRTGLQKTEKLVSSENDLKLILILRDEYSFSYIAVKILGDFIFNTRWHIRSKEISDPVTSSS